MRIELTDEKLTAYVLGELDEGERAAVEQALEDDEDARRTVQELTATARLAGEALAPETGSALDEGQRDAILARARDGESDGDADDEQVEEPVRRRRSSWWYAAAAVVLLGGVGVTAYSLMLTRGMQPLSAGVTDTAKREESRFKGGSGSPPPPPITIGK